ncbi:MAG: hypothetical protein ABJK28_08575 [Algibacter sp.]
MRNYNNPLKKIFFTVCIFISSICYSQYKANDDELRDYFSSILYLTENSTKTEKINGKLYEVIYREPWTGKILEKKNPSIGSGFFIMRGIDIYLVTAEHVARMLTSSSAVKFKGRDGKKKEFKISDLIKGENIIKKLNWIRHPKADVAVLHLGLYNEVIGDVTPMDYGTLGRTLSAPNRFNEITILGFPLGLGLTPNSISPISLNTHSASDIVYFSRFDNGITNPFVIMDDPSVGGFSGGPAMEIRKTNNNSPKIDSKPVKFQSKIVGLVHGTLGGGFSAIVPSSQIRETLELAPKYSGEYVFYYPNGNVWSKRIYKNGLPWKVISNFDPNGTPQEKGTLKDGKGTLYVWNENGTFAELLTFKNRDYTGGVYIFKDEKSFKSLVK